MPVTTIKVDSAVRDRLAAVARQRGLTMGALLDEQSLRLTREQRWAEIEAAYQRTRQHDPDGWRDYLGELTEVTVGERDDSAEGEWPEYNQ